MSKAFLEGYMSKESGWISEALGMYAPSVGGGIAGGAIGGPGGAALGGMAGFYAPLLLSGIVSLTKDTRDSEEQAEADQNMLSNYIPGVAPYNMWKRLGYSIRNPELKEENKKAKRDKLKKKLEENQ